MKIMQKNKLHKTYAAHFNPTKTFDVCFRLLLLLVYANSHHIFLDSL